MSESRSATYFVVKQHGQVFSVELFDAEGNKIDESVERCGTYFAFRATAHATAIIRGYKQLPRSLADMADD